MSEVRHINSANPFEHTFHIYRNKGWEGTLPLPYKKKNPPPTGYTGNTGAFPTDADIDDWLTNGVKLGKKHYTKFNIGLRLGNRIKIDGDEFEVIGLDVDDGLRDGKVKNGYSQFVRLQRPVESGGLGPLPDTWASSSREDGKSGIRFYLIPAGLHARSFCGDDGRHIDVIQYSHRFAVVYPSYHPEGGQYLWYAPGANTLDGKPDSPFGVAQENGRMRFVPPAEEDLIPDARELPLLPDHWVDFLTQERTARSIKPMDMDSSLAELEEWAKETLADTPVGEFEETGGVCPGMANAAQKHLDEVCESEESHQPIVNGHWHLYSLGVEGHCGWQKAINGFNQGIIDELVKKRQKRDVHELDRELWRSRVNALRKLKAAVADGESEGLRLNAERCACYRGSDADYDAANIRIRLEDGSDWDPDGDNGPKDPGDYTPDDDGNAEHLLDLFGDSVKYVPGLAYWIHWDGTRWRHDPNEAFMHKCLKDVKKRQDAYVSSLWSAYEAVLDACGGDQNDPMAKQAKAKFTEWSRWARQTGMMRGGTNCLEKARRQEKAILEEHMLDNQPDLLGVENGVVKLGETVELIDSDYNLFITRSTPVKWIDHTEHPDHRGYKRWDRFVRQVLPDNELRDFVQRLVGYSLLGHNRKRLMVFLYGPSSTGKSTFIDGIGAALGEDYAGPFTLAMFKEKASGLNPELAQALPKRVILTSEAGQDNHMHADVIKRSTGNDVLAAELKGANTIIRRKPAFVPFIATNQAPTIKGADVALKRRMVVIPFDQVVTTDKEKEFDFSTREMSEGILSWMIEGYLMYVKRGLDPAERPMLVNKTTDAFASELNPVAEFVSECMEKVDGAKVPVGHVYDAYEQWCMLNSIPERDKLSAIQFGKQLTSMGLERRTAVVTGTTRRAKAIVGYQLTDAGTGNSTVTKL